MAALSANCEGVHFDCSRRDASGNLAADRYASVAAAACHAPVPCEADEGMREDAELSGRPRHDAPAAVAGGD
jgi:hypothetical protein